jgi:hypothetical protein
MKATTNDHDMQSWIAGVGISALGMGGWEAGGMWGARGEAEVPSAELG